MDWLAAGAIALLIGLIAGWIIWGRRIAAFASDLREETAQRATAQAQAQRVPELQQELARNDEHIELLNTKLIAAESQKEAVSATLESERRESEEKVRVWEDARKALADAFSALSAAALKSNNQAFLELAKQTLGAYQEGAKGDLEKRQQAIQELVKPIRENLEKFDAKVQDIEKARVGAYEGLTAQIRSLLEAQEQLRTQATNLVQALRSPMVRGRWGEIQLRRVVEMAGMLNHCDFYEQESAETESGRLRPDLLIRLPANKTIVVDAKAPMSSYLDAVELQDEDMRREKLVEFSGLVRSHMAALSKKAYWDQFDPSPELVVMFMPGEHFYSAALQHDPSLIEYGVEQKVLIATPTSLITLLRAVAYGWRQEAIADNAKQISALAAELYKRIADMGGHWIDLGNSLAKSIDSYNKAAGSLESRVLVTARKFKELGPASAADDIEVLEVIGSSPRELRAPELEKPEVRKK
jgi:DNA recombination protein RmuC